MGNKKANSLPRSEVNPPRLNPNAPVNRPNIVCVPYTCVNGNAHRCRITYLPVRRCTCTRLPEGPDADNTAPIFSC
jgi:hypothetical protein